MGERFTRRWVLAAGGAGFAVAGTAGCGLLDDDPEPPPPPDKLLPLRDAALALAAGCDRAIAARPDLRPRLEPIAAAHREHAAALDAILRPPAPAPAGSSAPAGGPGPSLAELREAERQGHRDAVAACRAAPAERAALVGSIAAARACHAEALR